MRGEEAYKIRWVKWEKVGPHVKKGGWGFTFMKDFSFDLLGK